MLRFVVLLVVVFGLCLGVVVLNQHSARLHHTPPSLLLYTQIEPAQNDETVLMLAQPAAHNLALDNPTIVAASDTFYRASFLPDGGALIGFAPRNNASDIGRFGLADRHLTWLTNDDHFESNVAPSPDGRQIAYSVWVYETMETALLTYQVLYVSELKGNARREVPLSPDLYYLSHAWHDPHTLLVATLSQGTPRNALWSVDLTTGRWQALLQSDTLRYLQMATHPVDQTVAIIAAVDGDAIDGSQHTLHLMGPDGVLSDPLPLDDVLVLQDVAWSPDGAWIYVAGGAGYPALQDLYRIRPTGSDFTQLTHTPTLAEIGPSLSPPIDGPIHAAGLMALGTALLIGGMGWMIVAH